ncbi:MAG TPA: 50S ribosomal protein L13 [Armatimonadota bacterium]|jgi:large subunit ribosomal protein L13|nr:50S ribosomal protein L13 [Armatimonadota bacterium]
MAKAEELQRDWWVVDATGKPLGRLAAEVAKLLRGKHKPTFTPHVDTGDHVIIINAEKVVLTGNKSEERIYWHSQYPGGLKSVTKGGMLEKRPDRLVERTIKGMLPHNRLGAQMYRKLKVYAGVAHKHSAQQPREYNF